MISEDCVCVCMHIHVLSEVFSIYLFLRNGRPCRNRAFCDFIHISYLVLKVIVTFVASLIDLSLVIWSRITIVGNLAVN